MPENLWSFIEPSFARFADRPAWIRRLPKGKREVYTYAQVRANAINLSAQLRAMGIGAGSRVAILAPNGPEWGVAAFATWRLGGVLAPLHAGNSDEELQTQCAALAPDVVLYHGDDRGLPNSRAVAMNDASPDETEASRSVDATSGQEAVRVYTSGSTGYPKMVRLSHENIMSNVRGATLIDVNIEPADRFLSLLPLSHTMELTGGMMLPLYSGSAIVLPRILAAQEIMEAMHEESITAMIAVPRLYRNIMLGLTKRIREAGTGMQMYISLIRSMPLSLKQVFNYPLRRRLGGRIKCWLSGGSRLDPDIAEYFRDLGLPLRQGYGLTECSPVIAVQSAWEPLLDSVGAPFPGVEVKIRDPDPTGTGELLMRGPNLMLGYVDDEQTSAVMDDGWFRTGDLARLTESGKIVLTGRCKRLIVTEAGKNVYPEDLEVTLERDPRLKEAGVVEVDMRPAAVLAIDPPDQEEKAKSIIKEFNRKVSSHNHISRYAIVPELPRTPLGKVSLKDLPAIFAANEIKRH